ncbi:MAG: Hpt domain-containing protein [Oscillospiraceae bacterium]|nr:Hpt domain-containing protein [Oscillospiraceae bacterium]
MLTIEKLRAYGADVDEGLGRCMNNEAFYLRLVNMALDDAGFERLRLAVENGDKKESFEAAHALKGMLGNLSLSPLFDPASEMTELLRAGKDEDYQAWWEKIREQKERLLALRDEA